MSLRENFNRFYNSLQKSIEDENWYSALVLAVTLPDICCTLDESKVMVSNNKAHINSNEAYIKWFDKYINDYIWEWYKNGRVTETVV